MRGIKFYKTEYAQLAVLKGKSPSKLIVLDTWKGKVQVKKQVMLSILVSPYIGMLCAEKTCLKHKVHFVASKKQLKTIPRNIDIVLVEMYNPQKKVYEILKVSIFQLIAQNQPDCVQLIRYIQQIPGFNLSPVSVEYLKSHYYRTLMATWFLKIKNPGQGLIYKICNHIKTQPNNEVMYAHLQLLDKLCTSIFCHFYGLHLQQRQFSLNDIRKHHSELPVLFACMRLTLLRRELSSHRAIISALIASRLPSPEARQWQLAVLERLYQMHPELLLTLTLNALNVRNINLLAKLTFMTHDQLLPYIASYLSIRVQARLIKKLYAQSQVKHDLLKDTVPLLAKQAFPINLNLLLLLNHFKIPIDKYTDVITLLSDEQIYKLALSHLEPIARASFLIPKQSDYCFLMFVMTGKASRAARFIKHGYNIKSDQLVKNLKMQIMTGQQQIHSLETITHLKEAGLICAAVFEKLWFCLKQKTLKAEIEVNKNPMGLEYCCMILLKKLGIKPAPSKNTRSHPLFHANREKQVMNQFRVLLESNEAACRQLLLKACYDDIVYAALYDLYSHQVMSDSNQIKCQAMIEQATYAKNPDKASYQIIMQLQVQINEQQQTIDQLKKQLKNKQMDAPSIRRFSL